MVELANQEIDLLRNYPKTKRNLSERLQTKSEEHRRLARKFDVEFFDGDRETGYGGFRYHEKFWKPVVPDLADHFNLSEKSSVLDVGCAKGFMLVDLQKAFPGINLRGIDISEYAIKNAHSEVRDVVSVASCDALPFNDDSFDVIISITTIHNLDYAGCIESLKEIERVARHGSFITVDAYRTDEQKRRMEAWNLTAKTILHVDEWKELFSKAGYSGDYYWFMP